MQVLVDIESTFLPLMRIYAVVEAIIKVCSTPKRFTRNWIWTRVLVVGPQT